MPLQLREAFSSSVQYRGATCQLRPSTNSRLRLESACTRHCAASLSGGGDAGETTARARRTPLIELGLRTAEGHCTGRRPLSFLARPWCDMPTCGLQSTVAFRMARARAPLRCLSLGRRRGTRACRARAPQGAGCGWLAYHRRTLRRRTASLLHCKTVVRRARCGLQFTVGFRVARTRAPLRWVSLGRRRSTRGCRARAVPRCLWSDHAS